VLSLFFVAYTLIVLELTLTAAGSGANIPLDLFTFIYVLLRFVTCCYVFVTIGTSRGALSTSVEEKVSTRQLVCRVSGGPRQKAGSWPTFGDSRPHILWHRHIDTSQRALAATQGSGIPEDQAFP